MGLIRLLSETTFVDDPYLCYFTYVTLTEIYENVTGSCCEFSSLVYHLQ